ncbi:MAG: hypothetical protein ACJ79S_15895 [Gemmatimonadaceae bacterium]
MSLGDVLQRAIHRRELLADRDVRLQRGVAPTLHARQVPLVEEAESHREEEDEQKQRRRHGRQQPDLLLHAGVRHPSAQGFGRGVELGACTLSGHPGRGDSDYRWRAAPRTGRETATAEGSSIARPGG